MIILLDIEGTIAPISFVYEVLFPYARQHVGAFLEAHWSHPEVQKDVAGLADPPPVTPHEAAERFVQWMDQDRKLGALKSLQGRIWQHGYQQGQLRGQLFAEVAPRLKKWKEAGNRIYIYSSGSVLAQQLLLGHTQQGDLRPWVDGYFDTEVGAKNEAESYRRIASLSGAGLFATDVVEEARAAREGGWRAVILKRAGNHPQPAHDFPEWTELPEEVPNNGPC